MESQKPERHIGRKIWYGAAIVLSALILLLSVAGVIGAWAGQSSLSNFTVALLVAVEDTAGGLRQVTGTIDGGVGEVQSISNEVSDISTQISQNVENRGLIALLLLALACMDFQPRKGWKNIQERHETFAAVSDEIQRRAPDAVLGAYRAWDLAVHLNRAVYGFEQAQRREGRPNACEGIIDKYGIDTVVLVPLGLPALLLPEHTRLETYIENRYGPAPDPLKLIRVRP